MLPLTIAQTKDPLRVLCLGAHCDDIEIGCGGTILNLLRNHPDALIHWVVLSSNAERAPEARQSAAEYLQSTPGSSVVVRSFKESYFPYVAAEVKDFFEELKGAFDPNLIFTHHRADVHQDHRLVADLTWNTYRNHLILEYEIPKYEGDLGHPQVYVPIPQEIAKRKSEMLLRHFASQRRRSWFRSEVFESLMTLRGIECNAPEGFAEAFHVRKLIGQL